MNRRDFLSLTAKAAISAAVAGDIPATAWSAVTSLQPDNDGLYWTLRSLSWGKDISNREFHAAAIVDIHNGPAWLYEWLDETGDRFLSEFRMPYEAMELWMDDLGPLSECAVKEMFEQRFGDIIDLDVKEIAGYSDRWQWMLSDPDYQYTTQSFTSRINQRIIDSVQSDEKRAEYEDRMEQMGYEL